MVYNYDNKSQLGRYTEILHTCISIPLSNPFQFWLRCPLHPLKLIVSSKFHLQTIKTNFISRLLSMSLYVQK